VLKANKESRVSVEKLVYRAQQGHKVLKVKKAQLVPKVNKANREYKVKKAQLVPKVLQDILVLMVNKGKKV